MPIDSAALEEFEEVVGGENVSNDPAILDSYACHATWFGVPSQGLLNGIWWKRAGDAS